MLSLGKSGGQRRGRAFGLALGFTSANVMAGNGLNDVAFGAIGYGMAGADLAVSRDTSALNVNPAGLTQIKSSALDFYIEPFAYDGKRHTDALGNDRQMEMHYGVTFGGGYAKRPNGSNIVAGTGLFIQGGSGFTFRRMNNPFGEPDDISSTFSSIRIEPGIAWQVYDELSVGASVGINYSSAQQEFLPETSYEDPSGARPDFNGFRVTGVSGWSFNGKLGFQYRPNSRWVLAGAYTSETPIRLEGGTMTVDYSASGNGRVKYRSAAQTGLAIAQEAGFGALYRPSDSWLVAVEVNWVDWSSALKKATLKASNPESDQVPETLRITFPLDWRDQYVMAIGAEHQWSDMTTIRFGYSYGRNPIPERTLNPTLSLIAERTVAIGLTQKLGVHWDWSGSFARQLPVKVHYENPDSVFGSDASENWQLWVAHIMVSRRW